MLAKLRTAFSETSGYGPKPIYVSLPKREYRKSQDLVSTTEFSRRFDLETCRYRFPPSGCFPTFLLVFTNVAERLSTELSAYISTYNLDLDYAGFGRTLLEPITAQSRTTKVFFGHPWKLSD